MSQGITVQEYTVTKPCVCPSCGGQMTPAEYYVAVQGGTSSKQDWSQAGKVITTYTTQYRNIRRQIGGICTSCYAKEQRQVQKEYTILSAVLGAAALGCMVLFLVYLLNSAFHESSAGLGFAGLAGMLVAGFYALKNLLTVRDVHAHWTTVVNDKLNEGFDGEIRSNALSAAFVMKSKSMGFCRNGEVLLKRSTVQSTK